MNEQLSLLPASDTATDARKRMKRRWENGFQKWSDEHGIKGDSSLGACGYGSMCDYCEDNSYGRPCVRALNAMLRETGEHVDYTDYDFEKVWEGQPIICAECRLVRIHGDHLYCSKAERLIYNAKPKWCPLDKEKEHEQS